MENRKLLIKNDLEAEFYYFDLKKNEDSKFSINSYHGKFINNKLFDKKNEKFDNIKSLNEKLNKKIDELIKLGFVDFTEDISSWEKVDILVGSQIGILLNMDDFKLKTYHYFKFWNRVYPIVFNYEEDNSIENSLKYYHTLIENEEKLIDIMYDKLFEHMKEEYPEVIKIYSEDTKNDSEMRLMYSKILKEIINCDSKIKRNEIIEKLSNFEFVKIDSDNTEDEYYWNIGFGFSYDLDLEHGVAILFDNLNFSHITQRNDLW
jgi:hypothetical protein